MHNLLGLVGNLRGIVGVRERVSSVPTPPLWNAVETALGPFNVYGHIVEPHVSARTIQLVSCVWKETISALDESLKKFDDGFIKDGYENTSRLICFLHQVDFCFLGLVRWKVMFVGLYGKSLKPTKFPYKFEDVRREWRNFVNYWINAYKLF